MGKDSRKQQRRQKKRQQHKREQQRVQNNPYRKIGAPTTEPLACYVNEGWAEKGMASIIVLKRLPSGALMLGAFLVDLWCIGLKDAWGRLNITRDEFDGMLGRRSSQVGLLRIDPSVVRRLVAGSIRFARQNGFRLPRRYDRWTPILGDLGDLDTADLSDFGIDGGLRYVGAIEDLQSRLVGCSVEEFLRRPKVDYITGPPPGPWLDDDTGDEVIKEIVDPAEIEQLKREGLIPDLSELPESFESPENDAAVAGEVLEKIADEYCVRVLKDARKWCAAHQEAPADRLPEAVDLLVEAIVQNPMFGNQDVGDKSPLFSQTLIANGMSLLPPQEQEEMETALEQLSRYIQQYENEQDWARGLGLNLGEESE